MEKYINDMFDKQLAGQKAGAESAYEASKDKLTEAQLAGQKKTDADLTRTYVEAAKAAKNYNEVQNAYGLTSGAMAQARLAQDNQLQADLTALRGMQMENDDAYERQRAALGKDYETRIAELVANNDMQRAQALYNEAKAKDSEMNRHKLEGAQLIAKITGDYTALGQIYGLTPEQIALLNKPKVSGGGGHGGGSGDPGVDDDGKINVGAANPEARDEFVEAYMELKRAGAPTYSKDGLGLDAVLREAISNGIISKDDATELRSTGFGTFGRK